MKIKLQLLSTLICLNTTIIFPQYQQVWQSVFSFNSNSNEVAIGMGVDINENIYVLGNVNLNNGNSRDLLIIKFNSQGDTVWTRLFDLNPGNTTDAYDYFVDTLGNCYLLGSSYNNSTFSTTIVTVKYNSDGDLLFSSTYQSISNVVYPKSLIVDDTGEFYVLIEEGEGLTVVKYNPDGSENWRRSYTPFSTPEKFVKDNNGFLIVGGTTFVPNNDQDFFVLKINASNGDSIWTKTYDRAGYSDYLYSIAVDNQNNILMCGEAPYSFNYLTGDFAVVKLNSAGQFQWARFYNGPTDKRDMALDVIADDDDNVFVGGNSFDQSFRSTAVVIKYSPAGDSLETFTFNGDTLIAPGTLTNNFNMNKSNLFGPFAYFQGLLFLFDSFLAYYGAYLSTDQVETAYYLFLYAKDGNALIADLRRFIPNLDITDVFVPEYFPILEYQNSPNIILGGTAQIRNSSNFDIFVAKFSNVTNVELSENLPDKYFLEQNYPNPFNPSTKISFSIPNSSFVTLKVYDVLGNEVAILINEYRSAGTYEVEFNASKLSSGLYTYTLIAGSFSSSRKMMVIK
ncbi:T9SS type A sorting domain-containing protein [Ignavibacterium sp.]|uniref:T9SS type A sorting domain-containing protein n=1 Tax=Ignavibacterium sp. TaxID=2651167 RepID=UPI00329751A5